MKWFNENPFLAGIITMVIIGSGIFGYFIAGAAARYSEISQNYDLQVAELTRLKGLPLHPNEANVSRLSEQTEEFKQKIAIIKDRLVELTPAENEISPANFQAKLRERVDDFTARAKAANVVLPENFYLGFDAYRSGPPSSDAVATALNRQLAVIEKILDIFLAQRVAEIRFVKREPLPEEKHGDTQSSAQRGPNAQQEKTAGRGAQNNLIMSSPFDVSILSEQDRIRRSLNEIAKLPFFVPIRSLTIKNTNPNPPKRTSLKSPSPTTTTPSEFNRIFSGQSSGDTTNSFGRLEFIVGTERLDVILKLEYTLFP